MLQKLCLFNCKLDQEAAEQLVASLEAGGFANLQELDLTGNNIEAPQMQALLQALQHQDRAPALKVIPWLLATAVIMHNRSLMSMLLLSPGCECSIPQAKSKSQLIPGDAYSS